MTIKRGQLRAARMLLCLSQHELAALANVGVATIRRYETGREVGLPQVEALRSSVEAAGIVLLRGETVAGMKIGDGVALASLGDLPAETRTRLRERDANANRATPLRAGRPTKRRS